MKDNKIQYISFFDQLGATSFLIDLTLTTNMRERYLVYASISGFVLDAGGIQYACKASMLLNGGTIANPVALTALARAVPTFSAPVDGSINISSDWIWTGAVPVLTPSMSCQITLFQYPGVVVTDSGYWATLGFLNEGP